MEQTCLRFFYRALSYIKLYSETISFSETYLRSHEPKCCHLVSHMVFRPVLKGVLAADWLIFRTQQKIAKIMRKIPGVPKYFMNGIVHVVLCYGKGWGFYEACKR